MQYHNASALLKTTVLGNVSTLQWIFWVHQIQTVSRNCSPSTFHWPPVSGSWAVAAEQYNTDTCVCFNASVWWWFQGLGLWQVEDTSPRRRAWGSINFSVSLVITKGKRWHFRQRVILTDCLLEGVMQRANVYFRPQCSGNGQGERMAQSTGLYLARSLRTLVGLNMAAATPHTHTHADTQWLCCQQNSLPRKNWRD